MTLHELFYHHFVSVKYISHFWYLNVLTFCSHVCGNNASVFHEKSGRYPAVLMATNTNVLNEKSGHFATIFVVTKTDIVDEKLRNYPAAFGERKLDIFNEKSGHVADVTVAK